MEKKMENEMETEFIWGIIGVLGDCQNYGPFLDPYYNTAPNM